MTVNRRQAMRLMAFGLRFWKASRGGRVDGWFGLPLPLASP